MLKYFYFSLFLMGFTLHIGAKRSLYAAEVPSQVRKVPIYSPPQPVQTNQGTFYKQDATSNRVAPATNKPYIRGPQTNSPNSGQNRAQPSQNTYHSRTTESPMQNFMSNTFWAGVGGGLVGFSVASLNFQRSDRLSVKNLQYGLTQGLAIGVVVGFLGSAVLGLSDLKLNQPTSLQQFLADKPEKPSAFHLAALDLPVITYGWHF